MEAKPVGLDVGFRETKAFAGDGSAQYVGPSAVVEAPRNPMAYGQARANYTDKTDGRWLVGQPALDYAAQAVEFGSTDSSFFTSDAFRILGLHALEQVVGEGPVHVVIGLPMEFMGRIKGRVTKEVESWSNKRVWVDDCTVVPQPLGTTYDIARDWKGSTTEDFRKRRIGIIDIGGGTCDCMEIYDGRVTDRYRGWSKGVSDMHNALHERLNKRYRQEYQFQPAEIPEIFRSESFDFAGEAQDVSKPVREIRRQFLESLGEWVNGVWPEGTARLYRLIFTGGGAEALRKELEKPPKALCYPKQVQVPDDAMRANARGFAKLARQVVQQRERAAGSAG